MRSRRLVASIVCLAAAGGVAAAPGQAAVRVTHAASFGAAPVRHWSTEARRAIVPPTAGAENYGNKFPGEAAIYMGIVHIAIYDAADAIEGGYRPFGATPTGATHASPAAAIATAAHDTLIGLQPALGLAPAQQAILDGDYATYLAGIPAGHAKTEGIKLGRRVAATVVASRQHDGRDDNPTIADLNPPPPGPGVWQPIAGKPALGLRVPGIRPLALRRASQFRPGPPNPLTSAQYAADLNQVERLGAFASPFRTPDETGQALFWTDHDLRQWNDGLLRLAQGRGLDLVQTARLLAMAHVAGGDAMIGCFDAKYHYWFWRPYAAIQQADTDGNPATEADPAWQPLGSTPNFPEYPSAHACHSAATVAALQAFFGRDGVPLVLDSRATGTARHYQHLHDVVRDVIRARILVGFHFRSSDEAGAALGRRVGWYVAGHDFQPVG